MRILVAEDDRATRTRLLAFLREWGHEAIGAADGDEAWRMIGEQRPEILITDWLMPGMDGPTLLKKIRSSCKGLGEYVYAILLTSRSEKGDVVEGMESGADDFVTKPFDKEELRVRVQAAQRIIELEAALADQNHQLEAANDVLSLANQRMKKSLEAAARIQRSFLPEKPPESDRADFAWFYEPCDELGGDTLNVVPLTEDQLGVYIMDVSGHGVPAALLSVNLSRYLMRSENGQSVLRLRNGSGGFALTTPAKVIGDLNRHFAFDDESAQYFTALYGILDLKEGEFRYASGGHPGPLLVSGGKGTLHPARPPAVGFIAGAHFQEDALEVKSGDRLYFYTDGIFEISNADGEEFGQDRLLEALEKAVGLPLNESLRRLVEATREWSDGEPFDDDVSLIGVELK
ncbi:PP2C family protein-serine/threonine phosphatase [Haloferula sp.]|uniref:PP2C family protein-serine/threonine phosphatase n=1 Tax=Haloferula sp. TaxID=2497595 RepID=UPI003C712343